MSLVSPKRRHARLLTAPISQPPLEHGRQVMFQLNPSQALPAFLQLVHASGQCISRPFFEVLGFSSTTTCICRLSKKPSSANGVGDTRVDRSKPRSCQNSSRVSKSLFLMALGRLVGPILPAFATMRPRPLVVLCFIASWK